ncbi:MAG: LysR family transcriptional regulator [Rhodocyclaceae bacterium]|nr:LysR family transcriptional regulator [Rhodocyclaceae bacterium]
MDRTAEMLAFVRAVDCGGFSAAARELELTPSALSKLVSRLEDRLGVRLLSRTTRRLQMTAEGETFYLRAKSILAALDEAEAEVTEANASPSGLLRLYCGSSFGSHQLAPALPRFLERYPDVNLELSISDQPPETLTLGENFDVVIRKGQLEDSSLIARRICDVERVICAAPAYLEKHGIPRTPDELLAHNCLWITRLPALRRWPFTTRDGIRTINVNGNVAANNAGTVLQLALAGVGITRLTDVTVGEALRSGQLVPVLAACQHVEPIPLYALYSGGRHVAPKVRAMVDFLIEEFGHAPWRQAARR